MSSTTFKKGLLASSIAMVLSGVSTTSVAADAAQADDQTEVIEVTGIRGSNRAVVNAKRFNDSVVDSVSAEDIGQLPDSDVGQSLARIPGVTVARSFGQGASVSIRGTDPRMTLTTLNGQNVASTGWYDQLNVDRSFNYSMLPSELIGGMEVYKSSQADLVEGGIGGTVIVKTRKPLDLDANTVFGSVKGEYGKINQEISPEFSGLYSWKNEEENFGILVSAATVDREYARSGTESDLDWGGRSSIQPSGFYQEQERTAINVAAQYRLNENLEFGVNYLSLELGADSIGANMYINTDTDWGDGESNCLVFNDAGVCTYSQTSEENASRVFFQNWARKGEMTSDTFEFNAKYEADDWSLEFVAGSTEADGGTQMSANFGYGWWGDKFNQVKWAGIVDATGKQIDIRGKDMSFTRDELDSSTNTSTWTGVKGPNSDEETYAQVDFDYDLDLEYITKVQAGVRYTEHEFEKSFYNAVYVDNVGDLNSFDTEFLYTTDTMKIGNAEYEVPMANLDNMINGTLSLVDHFAYNRPGYGLIEEDNLSAYVMFDYAFEGFRGNFGIRYISTDVTSTGHIIDNSPADTLGANAGWSEEKVSVEGDYSEVLPSFNLAYDLSDEIIVRFAASTTITRPNYDQLFLAAISGYPDDRVGNEEITFGNPSLEPMKSNNADLSLEYYYGDGNLASATIFYKDISDFIVGVTAYNQQIGVINEELGADDWTLNGFVNSESTDITGIEFQLNHAWDNGFGLNANYTYTDNSAPSDVYTDGVGQFSESSDHTANVVGYWENDVLSARVAYNYRSEYMIREYGKYYGNRMHDSYGTIDLTFGWNVTENIGLRLEVVNVTAEDDVQYGVAEPGSAVKPALQDGYPTWGFNGETTYKLGASFKF